MSRTSVGHRVRINFYFDEQMFEALRKLAVIKNVSYSELIRAACREFIVREGKAIIADGVVVRNMVSTELQS